MMSVVVVLSVAHQEYLVEYIDLVLIADKMVEQLL